MTIINRCFPFEIISEGNAVLLFKKFVVHPLIFYLQYFPSMMQWWISIVSLLLRRKEIEYYFGVNFITSPETLSSIAASTGSTIQVVELLYYFVWTGSGWIEPPFLDNCPPVFEPGKVASPRAWRHPSAPGWIRANSSSPSPQGGRWTPLGHWDP